MVQSSESIVAFLAVAIRGEEPQFNWQTAAAAYTCRIPSWRF